MTPRRSKQPERPPGSMAVSDLQFSEHEAGLARRDRDLLLRSTIDFWQPLSAAPLTCEDARQILDNMTGFFNLLMRWEAAAAAASGPSAGWEEAA